jgi:DNA-binding NarL/FixJ family response regulator
MQKLSPREEQVLVLFLKSANVRTVAETLDVSINTVRSQKVSIQRKLGLKNSIQLMLWGIKRGLVDLEQKTQEGINESD